MELTEAQYACIASYLPRQRGNVSLPNRQVLNAILYVAEHGCKWRGLPPRFGNWHTIYTRMNRWSKNGVLDRVFEQLQRAQLVRIKLEAYKRRNEIERLFRRLKGYRRIFSRFEKLDVLFLGFIHFVLIFDTLLNISVNRP